MPDQVRVIIDEYPDTKTPRVRVGVRDYFVAMTIKEANILRWKLVELLDYHEEIERFHEASKRKG